MIRRSRPRRRRSHDDICAESFQIANLFRRSLVGHHKDALVAFDRRRERKPHARVARSRFDNRPAGFKLAIALSRFDHRHADAILDRIARIEIFHLGENRRLQIFGDAVELDERRVPHQS